MKHKNTSREYAFLMIEYETPTFIKDLQNSIKKEELYTEEDNDDYGSATKIALGTRITGNIQSESDVDFYKFVLKKRQM